MNITAYKRFSERNLIWAWTAISITKNMKVSTNTRCEQFFLEVLDMPSYTVDKVTEVAAMRLVLLFSCFVQVCLRCTTYAHT
jgi:hypothetical protein